MVIPVILALDLMGLMNSILTVVGNIAGLALQVIGIFTP
jgi:hypothetical protein